MRWVSTRVFPEPAPARMSKGPSPWRTASSCGGFNTLASGSKARVGNTERASRHSPLAGKGKGNGKGKGGVQGCGIGPGPGSRARAPTAPLAPHLAIALAREARRAEQLDPFLAP